MKQTSRGFTLIELMIVVAIVAILASIVYPSYRDSIIKGRRAQGRTALMELMQQQERYMTQRNCYLGFTTNSSTGATSPSAPKPAAACGGVTASSAPFKGFSADTIANSAYILSADVCPGPGSTPQSIAECVQVTATPVQISSDLAVGKLQVTSTGQRTCTGTSADSNGMSKLCWP